MMKELVERHWDVIVIGTGIGGGTIGRRLAEKGLSVLFLEKGPYGARAEQHSLRNDIEDAFARSVRGYWPTTVRATIDGKTSDFFAPLGAGVGGSSAFYAATLERPERHDIDDCAERPHPSGGWPVSYNEFLPFFEDAEKMYHVCGTHDPLSDTHSRSLLDPPPLGPLDRAMMQGFQDMGLHPYLIHLGVRFLPGCTQCFGYKCPRVCKMDSRSAGVDPALATGNAYLIDMCEVDAICGEGKQIDHLIAHRDLQQLKFRAKRYILSAGAMGSAKLLLKSRSNAWPHGYGNSSGLVGRNLMFHLSELVAIWPKGGGVSNGPTRSLAMRDFYFLGGIRFGSFQAMGVDASYGEIIHYLNNLFDRSVFRGLKIVRPFLRIPALLATKLFGSAKVFVGIIEDFPHPGNRVLLDDENPDRLRFEYRLPKELTQRRRVYRKHIRRKLRGLRSVFLSFQADLNLAHCCGTLRCGNDPQTSVLDRNCRSHDIENLYAVDASFMPTSLGINPSLMIASNALRVAEKIAGDLAPSQNIQEQAIHAVGA